MEEELAINVVTFIVSPSMVDPIFLWRYGVYLMYHKQLYKMYQFSSSPIPRLPECLSNYKSIQPSHRNIVFLMLMGLASPLLWQIFTIVHTNGEERFRQRSKVSLSKMLYFPASAVFYGHSGVCPPQHAGGICVCIVWDDSQQNDTTLLGYFN